MQCNPRSGSIQSRLQILNCLPLVELPAPVPELIPNRNFGNLLIDHKVIDSLLLPKHRIHSQPLDNLEA